MLQNSGKQPHLMITSGSHLENLQSMVLYEASFQKSEPAQPSYLLLCLKGLQTPTVPRGTCSVCDVGTHATSVQVRGQLGAFSFLHPLCFEARSLSFLTLCVNSRLGFFMSAPRTKLTQSDCRSQCFYLLSRLASPFSLVSKQSISDRWSPMCSQ